MQKLRPIFLVDKSIHDEAIPFKNNLVKLTIPTAGVPIVVLFSMSWFSHNLVYTETICAPKKGWPLEVEPLVITSVSEK